MDMVDSNFGITVLDILNETKQGLSDGMLAEGKTEQEISAFFESENWGEVYKEFCYKLIESLASYITDNLADQDKEEKELHESYREHLQSVWGEGLAWLHQFYSKCIDICEGYRWYIDQAEIVPAKCNLYNALLAIHGKALLVYAEIICLLENGFPDGAYAHYRMLYELWAVAEFLNADTDDVSRAFLESADAKANNETSHYKWAKISSRFCEIEKEITISSIVSEAHRILKTDSRVTASNTHLKKLYTFPNQIIHPSAAGVLGRTAYSNENLLVVGNADSGLCIPAMNASMTMFNISQIFLSMVPCTVSAVGLGILNEIIGKNVIPVFEEIEKNQLHTETSLSSEEE